MCICARGDGPPYEHNCPKIYVAAGIPDGTKIKKFASKNSSRSDCTHPQKVSPLVLLSTGFLLSFSLKNNLYFPPIIWLLYHR